MFVVERHENIRGEDCYFYDHMTKWSFETEEEAVHYAAVEAYRCIGMRPWLCCKQSEWNIEQAMSRTTKQVIGVSGNIHIEHWHIWSDEYFDVKVTQI